MKSKFIVSAAEVGHNNLWQRSLIAFAIVSKDKAHVNSSADTVMDFLCSIPDINIIDVNLDIIGF